LSNDVKTWEIPIKDSSVNVNNKATTISVRREEIVPDTAVVVAGSAMVVG
jgi:hypothetical protein